MLAGCDVEQVLVSNSKANKPLSLKLINEITAKEMDPLSPILIRLFKQEAELEVWKQAKTGRFELLTTFPICRWSGELGPKIREGDRQAPEGFYNIAPAQMNPKSQLYLSFNLGFPNAYDRSLGRTGSHLMVHGDCTSSGCYAMTDELMSDIYALAREAFFGGQRSFQVQAYPFRMTAQNMAKHRNSANMPFWKMLKQGNDHFEVTKLEPKVDVCEQRYVFNAEKELDDIAQSVAEKQRKDEHETAELVSRGTPSVVARRGIDGGMHSLFAAKTPNGNTGLSDSRSITLTSYSPVPSVPASVNPPVSSDIPASVVVASPNAGGEFLAGSSPNPAREPAKHQSDPVRVASGASSLVSEGFLSSLARRIGIGGSDVAAAAPAKQATPVKQKAPPPVVATKRPAPVKQEQKSPPAAEKERDSASVGVQQPLARSNLFDDRWSPR